MSPGRTERGEPLEQQRRARSISDLPQPSLRPPVYAGAPGQSPGRRQRRDLVAPVVSTRPVVITHARGSYPVYVEPRILARLGALVLRHLPGRRVIMVADETVLRLFQAGRLGLTDWTGETLSFPAGEHSKSRETWVRLTDELL